MDEEKPYTTSTVNRVRRRRACVGVGGSGDSALEERCVGSSVFQSPGRTPSCAAIGAPSSCWCCCASHALPSMSALLAAVRAFAVCVLTLPARGAHLAPVLLGKGDKRDKRVAQSTPGGNRAEAVTPAAAATAATASAVAAAAMTVSLFCQPVVLCVRQFASPSLPNCFFFFSLALFSELKGECARAHSLVLLALLEFPVLAAVSLRESIRKSQHSLVPRGPLPLLRLSARRKIASCASNSRSCLPCLRDGVHARSSCTLFAPPFPFASVTMRALFVFCAFASRASLDTTFFCCLPLACLHVFLVPLHLCSFVACIAMFIMHTLRGLEHVV